MVRSDDRAPRRALPPAPGVALHELVYADICERIRSGEFAPDSKIPGERDLSAGYGVSRVTIRQALEKAAQHGLLVRSAGQGTFVTRPRIRQDLAELRTFRSSVAQAAMRPGYQLLGMQWLGAAEDAATHLDLMPGTAVLHVRQLGLANGRPLAAYDATIAPVVAAGVEAAVRTSIDRSTYEIAAAALSVHRLDVEQTFEAITLDADMAALLDVPERSSAFRVSSLFQTKTGTRIEYRVATYSGERYSFRAHRTVEL